MKNTIKIDVASFYTSDFQKLTWTSTDEKLNGTSTLEAKQDDSSLEEIVDRHLQKIAASLPEAANLSDYETTLSFDDSLNDDQKKQFTAAFNASNTRDESF
ncbi:hypothetical protein ACFSQ3_12835 [Sphingobacterium corticis]|uniref:Uncharacterized protein n=1 Tax=Sphingobacterium corticis TaxID=1812823 RepID=A0ABW5NME6_9SPHI